jgi:Raf kinase inhibitor-like YbhB/YbcL family protein
MRVKRELSCLNKSYNNLTFPQRTCRCRLFISVRLNQFIDMFSPLRKYLSGELLQMLQRQYCLWCSIFCGIAILIALRVTLAGSLELLINSIDFTTNEPIPVPYTCSGDNKSPSLAWSGVPVTTKTLALIVRDPDAPIGSYVHWVLYNLPANVSGLPAAIPTAPTIAQGAVQGVNGSGASGYQGPCPPPGAAHHYHFKLYALDVKLGLPLGATADEVEHAMNGHVIASAELIGTFGR